ncbi:helix-turn-helix domain-containing protein [Paenibacillus lutrae]|nr:helix-turn-helix domain-containing protein [Paenibacillus lutrae]
MKESKADLIVHPIRMKIIQTLIGDRRLSVQQIGERLPEVPQASLYRHIRKLAEAGVLQVVEERAVRGTLEKVYALAAASVGVSADEAATETHEAHIRHFMTFLGSMLTDFDSALASEELPFEQRAGYSQLTFYLTEEEQLELFKEISDAFQRRMGHEPGPDRRKLTVNTILTIQKKPAAGTAASSAAEESEPDVNRSVHPAPTETKGDIQ